MKQHINFLKDFPKPEQQLPAQWIILGLISTLVLVTLVSIYLVVSQLNNYVLLKQAHQENNRMSSTFQEIAKSHPLLASDIPLAVQIATVEKELNEKQKNLEMITGSTLRYGFSNYLDVLSKIVPEGLWLKKIIIDQETKSILINGDMMRAVDMSLFLQALQSAGAFSKTIFSLFYIKDVKDKPYIEFNLMNEGLKS